MTDKIKFFTLNVFTNKIFSGNPLAVFISDSKLSDKVMQNIAAEINYSETTFVFPPENPSNSAKVRIFDPKQELNFAGHPNVGTGYLLFKKNELIPGLKKNNQLIFEEKCGLVKVIPNFNSNGYLNGTSVEVPNKFEKFKYLPVSIISSCLGIEEESIKLDNTHPVIASIGLEFAIAELKNKSVLSRIRYKLDAFENADKLYRENNTPFALMAFSKEEKNSFSTRVFAPLSGVYEDAATGSACGALGCLLANLNTKSAGNYEFVFRQGDYIGRPSKIYISVGKKNNVIERTIIKGNSLLVSEGTFYL